MISRRKKISPYGRRNGHADVTAGAGEAELTLLLATAFAVHTRTPRAVRLPCPSPLPGGATPPPPPEGSPCPIRQQCCRPLLPVLSGEKVKETPQSAGGVPRLGGPGRAPRRGFLGSSAGMPRWAALGAVRWGAGAGARAEGASGLRRHPGRGGMRRPRGGAGGGESASLGLREAFRRMDKNCDGRLDFEEIQEAARLLGLPGGDDYTSEVLAQFDRDGDGYISFLEYKGYIRRQERAMNNAFRRLDAASRGHFSAADLLAELRRIGIKARPRDARRMVQLIDENNDGRVSEVEWRHFVSLLPAAQVRENAAWALMASAVDLPPTTQPTSEIFKKLAIGALAGAVAKCVVAPFERLREVLQAAEVVPATPLAGVARQIIKDEGFWGLWRGNTLVLARVVPYVALQWSVYDAVQDALGAVRRRHASASPGGELGLMERLFAGIVAGTAATLVVYPLECLKTQVAVGGLRGNLAANVRQVLREEGLLRGFYKGLGPTISFKIIATAVGFNLHALMSRIYRDAVGGRRLSALEHGFIGGISGITCATLTLPLHSAVTKLRIQGVGGRPLVYRGLADCLSQSVQKAGVRSLFAGAVPTYAKVFPNVFIVYSVTAGLRRRWGVGGLSVYRARSASPKKGAPSC